MNNEITAPTSASVQADNVLAMRASSPNEAKLLAGIIAEVSYGTPARARILDRPFSHGHTLFSWAKASMTEGPEQQLREAGHIAMLTCGKDVLVVLHDNALRSTSLRDDIESATGDASLPFSVTVDATYESLDSSIGRLRELHRTRLLGCEVPDVASSQSSSVRNAFLGAHLRNWLIELERTAASFPNDVASPSWAVIRKLAECNFLINSPFEATNPTDRAKQAATAIWRMWLGVRTLDSITRDIFVHAVYAGVQDQSRVILGEHRSYTTVFEYEAFENSSDGAVRLSVRSQAELTVDPASGKVDHLARVIQAQSPSKLIFEAAPASFASFEPNTDLQSEILERVSLISGLEPGFASSRLGVTPYRLSRPVVPCVPQSPYAALSLLAARYGVIIPNSRGHSSDPGTSLTG